MGVWRRSISTLSPSKSMRSLTSSLDQLSRTRSSRSCLSRSRPGPVKEPGSRLLLPLETTMDTLVLVSSAPRRWPPPSEELSSWPSSPLFLSDVVSAPVPKKLLQMAGIDDCYTSARGSTGTLGNFAKATYAAVAATYAYLTPDLWKETVFQKSPYQEYSELLQ